MKTKIKTAFLGLFLMISLTYANEKNNENFLSTEKPTAPKTLKNWASKHGMTSQQYQNHATNYNENGFRLIAVDGYLVNGKVYFAALWKKGNTSNLIARHQLTGQQYQNEAIKLSQQGYRLIHVDGYSNGSAARYAAIWRKGSDSDLVAKHGLTSKQYQDEFNKNHSAGYRLVHVSGYGVKGKLYYAAIWKKGKNDNYIARHELTGKQYQDEYTKWGQQGYKLTHVDSYDAKGKVYYACIMEKVNGRYSAHHGMNNINYQLQSDNHYYQGYVPISISGHDAGARAGYAASFKSLGGWKYADVQQLDAKIKAAQKRFKVPGVSIAIVKDGKLVYAKGYGYGEKDKKEIASATSLFRVASVSKPITSIAIMKLVDQDKLTLKDKVFGIGRILGRTYGSKPYGKRERLISVENLLEHTAGGHAWDHNNDPANVDTWNPAMQLTTKESHPKLLKRILDQRNPTHRPGSFFEYSNFGYCVLGRIIEKKHVLKPSGITAMRIGASEKENRAHKEVAYYSNGDPYSLKMSKMDAHGGWIASSVDLMRLMVRVDGQPSKKDIISKSSFNAMTTSSLNNGYAKGWGVNSSASLMSHGGGMGGTIAFLKK
ncbi:MAG: serine hydrolase [Marinirhabdus sp.]